MTGAIEAPWVSVIVAMLVRLTPSRSGLDCIGIVYDGGEDVANSRSFSGDPFVSRRSSVGAGRYLVNGQRSKDG